MKYLLFILLLLGCEHKPQVGECYSVLDGVAQIKLIQEFPLGFLVLQRRSLNGKFHQIDCQPYFGEDQ